MSDADTAGLIPLDQQPVEFIAMRRLGQQMLRLEREISDLRNAAQRYGIREGETLAEFIGRLHAEANDDD